MAFGVSALPCRVSASCSSSSSGRAGVCGRGIVSAVIATTGPGCGRWSRKFRPEVRESGVPLAIDHMIGRTVSGEVKLRVDFGYNPVELDILRITAELRSTAAAASASAAAIIATPPATHHYSHNHSHHHHCENSYPTTPQPTTPNDEIMKYFMLIRDLEILFSQNVFFEKVCFRK